ncbi:MAG: hypothetical protein ACXVRV_11830 [Gaiellaceae bacterium]
MAGVYIVRGEINGPPLLDHYEHPGPQPAHVRAILDESQFNGLRYEVAMIVDSDPPQLIVERSAIYSLVLHSRDLVDHVEEHQFPDGMDVGGVFVFRERWWKVLSRNTDEAGAVLRHVLECEPYVETDH